jgi:hypothetical protein
MKKTPPLWAYRTVLVVYLPFVMIWNIGKTTVNEFCSMCWYIAHEPLLVWEEWIDAYRKGPPQ